MGAGKARAWAIEERRAEVAKLLRRGWTERRIAEELGIPKSTVHTDAEAIAEELVANRVSDAEKARALAAERLAVAHAACIQVLEGAEAGDPELVLKATDRIERIEARIARMWGLDAPERVDATVTEGPTPTAAARLVREVFASGGATETDGSGAADDGGHPGDASAADDSDGGSIS